MAKSNKKKAPKGPPSGFGRRPLPDDDDFEEMPDPPDEDDDLPKLPPPLAVPQFVGELEAYELLARYDIQALLPLSRFEYQLLEVIAGLESRVRELDPLP